MTNEHEPCTTVWLAGGAEVWWDPERKERLGVQYDTATASINLCRFSGDSIVTMTDMDLDDAEQLAEIILQILKPLGPKAEEKQ